MIGQWITGIEPRRFISEAVDWPLPSTRPKAAVPPKASMRSEIVSMRLIYTNNVHGVNMTYVNIIRENASMSEHAPDTKKDRLKAARVRFFSSARQAALRHGWGASTYAAHENGQNDFNEAHAREYARAYKVSAAWLLGLDSDMQAQEATAEDKSPAPPQPDASYPVPVEFPRRKLPVYGHAAGGLERDGKFILNGTKVADVLCPPELESVREAYAVYMHGDSMRPAFRPGDTIYINPSRPVAAGDEVLVQIRGEAGEPPYGFVKEFMRQTASELVLLQHNPPEGQQKIITFPVERVLTVHKVVGSLRG